MSDAPSTPQEPKHLLLAEAGWHVLALDQDTQTIAQALVHGQGCTPMAAGGRNQVARFSYQGGTGILRHYQRGGLIAPLLHDRYFENRPLREFRLHRDLFTEGLPVPLPLGVAWHREGPFLRGAFATRELEGRTLDAWLREAQERDQREPRYFQESAIPSDSSVSFVPSVPLLPSVLAACGKIIRQMHDLGVWHADLNANNLFITPDGPCLLDFDKALRRTSLDHIQRSRNLLRLRRSLEKRGHSGHYFAYILEGYGSEVPPEWLDRLYTLKGRVSDWLQQRDAGPN